MATSSTVFSLLLLLIFVCSFYMDEALGAQTEIRKLKEMMKMRRNLEGNDERSSKMATQGSVTKRCQGASSKDMKRTYSHVIQGRDSSSLCSSCSGFSCIPCSNKSPESHCYSYSCSYSERCQQNQGSPKTCNTTEHCTRTSG